MREPVLMNVREQLLRSGVAPRHVKRYVRELRDHLTDLVARERSAGLDPLAAEAKARLMLGSDAQLVQAMIDRGAPRSLSARAPWAVFAIVPPVALVILMILLGAGAVKFFAPLTELPGAAIPQYARAVGVLFNLLGSYGIGPLLAATCIAIALRQRVSSRWVWAGLALIALVSGPLGVHVDISPAVNGAPGGIHGSLVQTVHATGHVDVAATLLLIAIRTSVVFVLSAVALRLLRQHVASAA